MRQLNQTNETRQVYETPVCEIVKIGPTQMLAESEWVSFEDDLGEAD